MRLICIFLSVIFLLISCATKRKIKEVEKIEIKTGKLTASDSVLTKETILSKAEMIEDDKELERIVDALSIEYDGDQENNLKILIGKTDNQTSLNIVGKGKISFNERKVKTKASHFLNHSLEMDSIHQSQLKKKESTKRQSFINSVHKKNEKSTSGLQFGFYLLLLGVVFSILFAYIFIRYFKLSKD